MYFIILRHFINKKETRAKILIYSAWLLSGLFSVPALFLNEIEIIKERPQCWIELTEITWRIYITLVALTLFIIPSIIITTCYTIIIYTIWTKSRLMAPITKKCTNSNEIKTCNDRNDFESEETEFKRASSRGVIPRAKIKTVKMTFVIVIVFTLCWSPYFIWSLLQVYEFIPKTAANVALSTFIQSLTSLNSAANPIIYCIFSTHILKNLRKNSFCNWIINILNVCWSSLRKRQSSPNDSAFTLNITQLSNRTATQTNQQFNMKLVSCEEIV